MFDLSRVNFHPSDLWSILGLSSKRLFCRFLLKAWWRPFEWSLNLKINDPSRTLLSFFSVKLNIKAIPKSTWFPTTYKHDFNLWYFSLSFSHSKAQNLPLNFRNGLDSKRMKYLFKFNARNELFIVMCCDKEARPSCQVLGVWKQLLTNLEIRQEFFVYSWPQILRKKFFW